MPEFLKLRCELTDADRKRLSEQLVEALSEKSRLEYEKSSTAKSYKDEISEQNAIAARVSGYLRTGYEMRDVEIKLVKDIDRGVMRTVRVDNGETVSERGLIVEERQQELPLEPGQEPAPTSEHLNDVTPQPLGANALWDEWLRLWTVSPDERKTSHKKLRADWREFAGDRAELIDPIGRLTELVQFGMLPQELQGLELSKSSVNIIQGEKP